MHPAPVYWYKAHDRLRKKTPMASRVIQILDDMIRALFVAHESDVILDCPKRKPQQKETKQKRSCGCFYRHKKPNNLSNNEF
jgi:ferredoxin-thioredoxin reductase catalytic subunit